MKFPAAVVLATSVSSYVSRSHHTDHNAKRPIDARRLVSAGTPDLADSTTVARSSAYIPFCGGQKRATASQIAYVGNTGSRGHYGCNIMLIPASIASEYKYSMQFINEGSNMQQCKCWNKIGPEGAINGFFRGNEAISFTLAVSGQQFIVFDENSQIGCSCHANFIPLTINDQFASTWVEADFGDELNENHSGFDASCLVAAHDSLDIPGLSVCSGTDCSTVFPGGTGENAYLEGMDGMDGIGVAVDPGPVALTVKIDIT